jgi:glycerol-3-phosphate acyltransferase PlsY
VLASVLSIGFGFLLGSIPFGVVIARRRGIDLRTRGSGNIGATNATRVMGLGWGALVLVLDAGKGALATWIAMRLTGCDWIVVSACFAAVLGHCFSPFLGWKGGKGVATALGVFVVIDPVMAAAAVLVFAGALFATRVPALGSLSAAAAIAVLCIRTGDRPAAVLACALLVLLVYTHRGNLAKLRVTR